MNKKESLWEWLKTFFLLGGLSRLPLIPFAGGTFGRLPGLVVPLDYGPNVLYLFSLEAMDLEFPNLSQSRRKHFNEGVRAMQNALSSNNSLDATKLQRAEKIFHKLSQKKTLKNSVCILNNLGVLYTLQTSYSDAQSLLEPLQSRPRYGNIVDFENVKIVQDTIHNNYEIAARSKFLYS